MHNLHPLSSHPRYYYPMSASELSVMSGSGRLEKTILRRTSPTISILGSRTSSSLRAFSGELPILGGEESRARLGVGSSAGGEAGVVRRRA